MRGSGPGAQVEVVVLGENEGAKFSVLRDGVELPGLSAVVKAENGMVRYVLRAPHRVEGGIEIGVIRPGGGSVRATKQWPEIADVARGKREGTRHRGGVTFSLFR